MSSIKWVAWPQLMPDSIPLLLFNSLYYWIFHSPRQYKKKKKRRNKLGENIVQHWWYLCLYDWTPMIIFAVVLMTNNGSLIFIRSWTIDLDAKKKNRANEKTKKKTKICWQCDALCAVASHKLYTRTLTRSLWSFPVARWCGCTTRHVIVAPTRLWTSCVHSETHDTN